LKSEGGVGRQAVGEGISREGAKGDHFPKIQNGSWFLGLRWLDTAWDFPIDALYSHPKLRQSGALQDTLISKKNVLGNCTTWARELTENLFLPLLRAFASSRQTLSPPASQPHVGWADGGPPFLRNDQLEGLLLPAIFQRRLIG
jgi:hypothetical protein